MAENTKEKITPELLFRYCSGACSSTERSFIESAMSESDELRSDIANINQTLQLTADLDEFNSFDVDAAYKKVWNRTHRRKRFYILSTKVAAIIALPLLFSTLFFGYAYFDKSETPEVTSYTETISASGTITRHELPDQTVVWLNSGSKLRYPTRFNSKIREVTLEGEAYFEVHADKEHPFYVNTPEGMKVYAYGTKFNVSAYGNDSFIETALAEGHVNVIEPIHNQTITLLPGEKLFYDKQTNSIDKSEADIYEKIAWKDGKIIFRNAPLESVLKRLARFYNVNIKFENKSGKEFFYRATFRNETITQVLECLSESANLKWNIKKHMQTSDSSFIPQEIIVTLY